LDKSFHLLDILEFVKVTEFELNMVMFDYFWQIVVGNTRSHLTTRVLQWFGYEGDFRIQKQNFVRMLKTNKIAYTELTQHDNEIELYPTIKEESALLPSNVTNSKFLIMQPNDLKMAIMQLKTKNGSLIRQYYIDLEELLKLYVEYTLYFNHRESQRKITDLEKMMADIKLTNNRLEESNNRLEESNNRLEESNRRQEKYMKVLGISLEEVKDQNEELKDKNDDLNKDVKDVKRKLGIAVEDRAPLPVDLKKQERFVLLKRNDPDHAPYYTIRAQHAYTTRKLKAQKIFFPDLEVLLDFKANPNSKTLYVRIKDELKAKGVLFDGNNIDLDESEVTEDDLIEEMRVINDQKYDVGSN
jgi:hypothetical protein